VVLAAVVGADVDALAVDGIGGGADVGGAPVGGRDGAGAAADQVDLRQFMSAAGGLAQPERAAGVGADVDGGAGPGIAIDHLGRAVERMDDDHRGVVVDMARRVDDHAGARPRQERRVAPQRAARRQVESARAVEVDAPQVEVLVEPLVAAEQDALAVGEEDGRGGALGPGHQLARRALGVGDVGHVDLADAVAIGAIDQLRAVGREHAAEVRVRLEEGAQPRQPGGVALRLRRAEHGGSDGGDGGGGAAGDCGGAAGDGGGDEDERGGGTSVHPSSDTAVLAKFRGAATGVTGRTRLRLARRGRACPVRGDRARDAVAGALEDE
jgi:hypothetical protein